MADLKNDKSKPDLSLVASELLTYTARAKEYGNTKYARGNYRIKGESPAAAKARLRRYLAAAARHLHAAIDAAERDDDFVAADKSDSPPSALPHVCGVLASLEMFLEIGCVAGILPRDPGQTWSKIDNELHTSDREPDKADVLKAGDVITEPFEPRTFPQRYCRADSCSCGRCF